MTHRTSGKRTYTEVSEEDQKAIVSEYQPNVRGSGRKALAKRFGRSPATIQHVLSRAKANDGNSVTPRGHRKRKLSDEDEQLIRGKLDEDPYLTNHQLSLLVDEKISSQTVSNILHRCDPPFTQKVPFERHPETITEEWQEDVDRFIHSTLSHIPLPQRIYEDETGVSLKEAPKKGRARKGFRITRPRQSHAKKLTLHIYASKEAVLYWQLSTLNASDSEIEEAALDALQYIQSDKVLLWDRLGGGGIGKKKKAQHYNLKVKNSYRTKGVRIVYLPPYCPYLNPIELLFHDLKDHYIRPSFHRDGSLLTFEEVEGIVRNYCNNVAPNVLPGFFSARANGRQMRELGMLDL
jgi:transposase